MYYIRVAYFQISRNIGGPSRFQSRLGADYRNHNNIQLTNLRNSMDDYALNPKPLNPKPWLQSPLNFSGDFGFETRE